METQGWQEAKHWEPEDMYNEGTVPTFIYAEADHKATKVDSEDGKY